MKSQTNGHPPRVLIAGGGGGVGLACAEALAECGADLILCDTNGAALTQAAERFHAFSRYCDLIADNSVAVFAAEIGDKYPSIDVLINAAGQGYVRALAMMRMTRAIMPMLRRGGSRRLVINVAPAGGFLSSDGMFPFASSLPAFERLSDAIAEQTKGTSIEVVNIAPKLVRGRWANGCPTEQLHQLLRVDEAYVAERIVALVGCGRSRTSKRASGTGSASRSA